MIKSITNFLIIFLYFSSLNLKYLKLTKMELSRFAMKLFISFQTNEWVRLTLFGMSVYVLPLFTQPDSTLPNKIVPISCKYGNKMHQLVDFFRH